MVVYDLHIESITRLEAKAQTPPVIDTNAPLTSAVTAQSLQPVARRNTEILKGIRIVQHLQFPLGSAGDRLEPAGARARK
jgi:hypothetical protein